MVCDKERQLCVVGVGRLTRRQSAVPLEQTLNPTEMLTTAARLAAEDSGVMDPDALLRDLVGIATPAMFLEIRWRGMFGGQRPYRNFSRTCATALGASPTAAHCVRAGHGGNGPQFLVSYFAELISTGGIPQGPILVGGVEENATFDRAARAGRKDKLKARGWGDGAMPPVDKPTELNMFAYAKSDRERAAQVQQTLEIGAPVYQYALLENAYAHDTLGRSAEEHLPDIADLFSRFSIVAAAQPEFSWFPQEKSREFLIKPTADNRIMGYPYRKWMCARDEVDQSAAVLLMSWAEAERRGIPAEKLVFLWGSGDCFDTTIVPLRNSLSQAPAMQAAYDEAFRSAGLGPRAADTGDTISIYDMYSCFPIAVEQACACVGLDPKLTDVSRLTATGGLPYHGGPGSNYSCHGLCALVGKLRTDLFRGKLGVVGANGGFLTEHSVGVYSTDPPKQTFSRRHHEEYATGFELPVDAFATRPKGSGRILSWTVRYARSPNLPEAGIVVGEMVSGKDTGKRFVGATRPGDERSIHWLLEADRIGSTVEVSPGEEPVKSGRFGNVYRVYVEAGALASL